MRVALYARYSDEQQNPRSIADQFAVLERHAAARGWTVVARFEDAAISGFAMANRPGLLALLATAESGARLFDRVLAEHEDRFSRDLADLATIAKRLRLAGAAMATLAADDVSTIQLAFNGVMAQQYLENLSQKTRRGMASNAAEGKSLGGRTYGYRSAPGGALTIEPAEAEIVRRIFADYAAGQTGREIADRLNRQGVPSPQGRLWSGAQITGSPTRANGILRTDLYRGLRVWGRYDMRKDPFTGKRVCILHPREQWKSRPMPDHRIVSDEAWAAVQARLDGAAAAGLRGRAQARRRPGVFTGLIRCGVCDATMTSHSRTHLICAAHRFKGPTACANGRMVRRDELEQRILTGLRTRLLHPDAVSAYVRAYHRAWAEAEAEHNTARRPLESRLGELARRVARLVDAIAEGVDTPSMRQRLAELEAERAQLAAQLQALDEAAGGLDGGAGRPIALHPRLPEIYAARVADLQARLATIDKPTAEAADLDLVEAVRRLVEKVTVRPATLIGRTAPIDVTLHGVLSLFIVPADALTAPEAQAEAAPVPQRRAANDKGAPLGAPAVVRSIGFPLVAGARSQRIPSFSTTIRIAI